MQVRINVNPLKTVPMVGGVLLFVVALLASFVGSAAALPTDRAYEMVSPPDKNDGDVGGGSYDGSFLASPSGDRFAYTAIGGFADAPANMTTGGYMAARSGTAWNSRSLSLPGLPTGQLLADFRVVAVSSDFTKVLSATNRDPETGDEVPDPFGSGGALYRNDPVSGEVDRVTPPSTNGSLYTMPNPQHIAGNPDFSRIFFSVNAPLTADAASLPAGHRLYMWEDGEVSLQSRLPNGDPVNGYLDNAATYAPTVSTEGDVLYFIGKAVGSGTGAGPLYRRDLSGPVPVTDLVNADENDGEAIPLGDASKLGGSDNGDVYFFQSNQRLVDADTDTFRDVYRYDHSKPAGSRLTLISVDSEPGDAPGESGTGIVGVGGDGDVAYFTSTSQLVAGAPLSPSLTTNFFVWKEGEGLDYITRVPSNRSVSSFLTTISKDGRYLGFIGWTSGITPEDAGDLRQIYIYDSETGDLDCASCVGGGAANTAAAQFRRTTNPVPFFTSAERVKRNVADDGEVFFETTEALLPEEDTNGKYDVYGWKKGRGVELYSTGRGAYDSRFLDASADGRNVFIQTREQLSAWDWDHHLDAYDVRVGDGLPEPLDPVPPCTGDECQGPAALPPVLSDPASSQLSSPGNRGQGDADCAKLERKAKRLKRKAKLLKRNAKRASGMKSKRLKREAKAAKRKSKQASRRVARCNAGGNS